MYKFYLKHDGVQVLLPITPSKLKTQKGNTNRTINILNMGEINLIGTGVLHEMEFSFMLPREELRYVQIEDEFKPPIYFLDFLQKCKESSLPTTLLIFRYFTDGSQIFSTNKDLVLEDYLVTENAGEYGSFWVDSHWKDYRSAKSTVYQVKNDGDNLLMVEDGSNRDGKTEVTSYTVKKGDTLWGIAKSIYNDANRYKEIASKNGITNPNKISIGMVLDLS